MQTKYLPWLRGSLERCNAVRSRDGVVMGILLVLAAATQGVAQETPAARGPIELSVERAVEMAMDDSYQVRRVRLNIERTRQLLRAEQAGLRSRVYVDFSLPEFEQISEERWNAERGINEIVGENSRRWQMDFSVEQPLILLGYPTNGYLSLNNRVYRYTQIDDDERDLRYYNRYFIRYRQPLFQPNELKNDIEEAELDLLDAELDFQGDAIRIIEDTSEDYYELLELAYEELIYQALVENLEQAQAAATQRAAADSSRVIDASQAQVALSNARSRLQQARSDFRLETSTIKPDLGLAASDSIVIRPVLEITPVTVDVQRAIELGVTLRPQLRMLEIERRQNEIDYENVRGRNSFRLDVELTYGREMQDPRFGQLMSDPRNSYTFGVRGSLPIWDWGERRARIEAERLVLARTDLSIEETREEIQIGINNTVRNLEEYLDRAQSMEENLELAEQISQQSLAQYREGSISIQDLLQSYERQESTALNFLAAYIGYRDAILELQRMTYYDFENQIPVLERFGVETGEPGGAVSGPSAGLETAPPIRKDPADG
ncbi:MAG: TolC family protein [Gemmatimonadota bacterium]